MDVELRAVRSFTAVADYLSFTKAAATLGVTQPYLSMQIKNLEERIGFPLFRRTSRRVEITPAGTRFLEAARSYMREADNLERTRLNLLRASANTISVGTGSCHADVRWSLLGRFVELCPQVAVNVQMYHNSSEIWAALRRDEIDVAIVVPPIPDDFEYENISDEHGGLILRSDAPMARASTIRPTDLAGQEIAIFPRNVFPALHDYVISGLKDYGASFRELPEPSRECAATFVRATGVPAIGAPFRPTEREQHRDIVYRDIEGHPISLNCVLVRSRSCRFAAANRLWKVGSELGARSGPLPPLPLARLDSRSQQPSLC